MFEPFKMAAILGDVGEEVEDLLPLARVASGSGGPLLRRKPLADVGEEPLANVGEESHHEGLASSLASSPWLQKRAVLDATSVAFKLLESRRKQEPKQEDFRGAQRPNYNNKRRAAMAADSAIKKKR
jgi:hypothetical protein